MRRFPDYFTIKEGRLFNTNTNRFEGMAGDNVEVPIYKDKKKVIVTDKLSDFTNYQVIPTREHGMIIMDSKDINDFKIL